MGFAVNMMLQVAFIMILCTGFSVITSAIIYSFFKENSKRKIFATISGNYFFGACFYIVLLLGGMILAEIRGTDAGVGDHFFIPLSEEVNLLMIDDTNEAYIEGEAFTMVGKIDSIITKGNKIYAREINGKYITLDLKTGEVDASPVRTKSHQDLMQVGEFYFDFIGEHYDTVDYSYLVFDILLTLFLTFHVVRFVYRYEAP